MRFGTTDCSYNDFFNRLWNSANFVFRQFVSRSKCLILRALHILRNFFAVKWVIFISFVREPANLAGRIPGVLSQRPNASVRSPRGVGFSADGVHSRRTRSAPQPPEKEDEES